MAITILCNDLILKIEAIDRKYPGGFTQFLADQDDLEYQWYDTHLFHDGSKLMDSDRLGGVVNNWESLGFVGLCEDPQGQQWQDFCYIDFFDKEAINPENCPWLTYDREHDIAYLTGTEPGEIATRNWKRVLGDAWNDARQCLAAAEIAKVIDGNDYGASELQARAAELQKLLSQASQESK